MGHMYKLSPVPVVDSQLGLKGLHGPIKDGKGAQCSKAACLGDYLTEKLSEQLL